MIENVYGFVQMPIEEARSKIEKVLGLTFELGHSYDRCGDYYIFEDEHDNFQIILQENCEEDPGEWTEDKHRDMGALLYVVGKEDRVEKTHAVLVNKLMGISLLRSA